MAKKSLFAALAALFFGQLAYAAEGCTLNKIQGDVQVMRDGQMAPAQEKQLLKKGDALQTGSNCMADMSMNDLAGCRLLAGTKVNVMGWKKENMALEVADGNVILNLKKLPEDAVFKVETPTAVATVRGTQFWGRVNQPAHPVTTFAVREGTVEIMDKISSKTFRLEKGQALDIPEARQESPSVRTALPEEMAAMEQADSIPMQG